MKGGYIMPDLRCTVQTCTHNQNYYCNLDSIVVGGNSAKKQMRQAVTVLKSEKVETPIRMHTRTWREKKHLPRVTWIVRQQTVCITKNVSVMQERSV
mgnify:FL=1